MKNNSWKNFDKHLDVPQNDGLADILIRLSYLEATIRTLCDFLITQSVNQNTTKEELTESFNEKTQTHYIALTAELVSKYHKSNAPDENKLH